MKKVFDRWRMMGMAFVMLTALSITTTKAQGSVSLQVFYDELQPYGTWMDHGQYGYVWMPRVENGFTPYASNGYWINTEYGNTWVSNYAWGWAPFHYGRWAYDDFYRWVWVPDTEWAPAWVAWRDGGGYYGWAPLMPGINMNMAFAHYDRIPRHHWNFVPYRYITYRHVYTHCLPRPQVVNIIHNTTIITNNYTDNRRRTYFTGPTRYEMERRGGGRVTVHKVSDTNRPGRTEVSRSTANFYRPEIDNSHDSRSRSVPSTYVRKDRAGNLETIESRNERRAQFQTQRTEEFRYNSRNEQSTERNEATEQKRIEIDQNVPQRQHTPSDRSSQRLRENVTRSYQPTQQERQPVVRDQNDFNERERVRMESMNKKQTEFNREQERMPANQDVQRRDNTPQPQQWEQRNNQNIRRQQTEVPSIQRDRSTLNTIPPPRTSGGQQHRQEFRKTDNGNAGQQPARDTNGSKQSTIRKRN